MPKFLRALGAASIVAVAGALLAGTASAQTTQANAVPPEGSLDILGVLGDGGATIRAAGWAADPASPERDVLVDVYVDGDYAHTTTTDVGRPDVAAVFPSYGGQTGFDTTFGLAAGTHEVCVFAIDEVAANTQLGCATVNLAPQDAPPVGHLDSLEVDGATVRAVGWAADPASPERDVLVDLYVDSDYAHTTETDVSRPDVAAVFPTYGNDTGLNTTFGLPTGTHRVCAFAIDQDALNTRLGCETVRLAPQDAPPVGHLDTLEVVGGSVRAAGWAADPASPERDVLVDLYVNGEYAATTESDISRPDVAAVFPTYGDQTGFDTLVDVAAGTHRVCAFAVDQDALNTRLGCATVAVPQT